MKVQAANLTLLSFLLATGLQAQTTVIDATFDGVANDTNNTFTLLTNTPAITSGASWDAVTGLINRGTNNNSTSGVTSDTTADFSTLGGGFITLTIVSEGGTGSLNANGMFFGFLQSAGGTDGTGLWNNLGPSFGLVINGSSAGRLGPRGVGPGGRTTSGTTFQNGPSYGTASNASINDGFTIVLTLSSAGYDISVTGLQTAGGAPITGGSGDWAGSTFDFADFSSTMHAGISTQGTTGGGTLDLASVTILIDPDTDGDGMPDSYEDATPGLDKNIPGDADLGADPGSFDGDGLTNLQEYNFGTDPNVADVDNDDLNDGGEFAAGTNPFNPHSDTDGLNDGAEVHGTFNPYKVGHVAGENPGGTPGEGTNPLEPDSDGDGLDDFVELDNGNGSVTNPNSDDTDGDNLLDDEEIANGLDPTDGTGNNSDTGDPDSDTLSNFDEIVTYGTDPLDDDSDGDDLKDGEEVNGTLNPYQDDHIAGDPPGVAPGASTDPLDDDSDDDGILDGAEVKSANGSITDPNDQDTDQDTLLDAFEIAGSLDPTDATGDNGAGGDPDDDNVLNSEEQTYGANPNLANSDGDSLDDEEEIFTWFTDPSREDTDGDLIWDDEEVVAGNDNFVTDPLEGDTDFDTFKDFIEIQAGSHPDDINSTPTFPAISWSAEAFDEETDLSTEGTLLFADNLQGADLTLNGIPFTGYVIDGTQRSTPNLQTLLNTSAPPTNVPGFYDDEVPALAPLLTNFWFEGNPLAVNLGITGLTPGESYLVQIGRADDRSGTILDRYMLADGYGGNNTLDPIGPTNTTYGGPDNPAILLTGIFTAQYTVQTFTWEQYLPDGTLVGSHIPFIQVREIAAIADIVVTSVEHTGSTVAIGFSGLNPAKNYRLVRSATLQDSFPAIVDGPRPAAGATDTFTDPSMPLPDVGFYRLQQMP